jgi:hypothetical protein
MPSGLYAGHLRSERVVLSLTAVLFPMPVQLGQSNITGGALPWWLPARRRFLVFRIRMPATAVFRTASS